MMIDEILLPKPCKEVDPLNFRSEMNGNSDLNTEPSVPLPNQNNRTDLAAVEEEWRTLSTFQDSSHDMASTTKDIACNALSSFPFRLHDMLNDATKKGFEDVVCWRDDDRSFLIRDKDRFALEVLPNYFQGQTHYKSFQRQRKSFSLWSRFSCLSSCDERRVISTYFFASLCSQHLWVYQSGWWNPPRHGDLYPSAIDPRTAQALPFHGPNKDQEQGCSFTKTSSSIATSTALLDPSS